jgi:S-adenosylmethionine synthetase
VSVVNRPRVVVERLSSVPVSELEVEIVERKGVGHPDHLIDLCSEAVSRELSLYYLKNFGSILHHNVDKGLLIGGRSIPKFGGGEVIEPINIIVAGRATTHVIGKDGKLVEIPFGTIAMNAIKSELSRAMRFLDPERHVIIQYYIRPGSVDLTNLFANAKRRGSTVIPLANDTSMGVSFYPFTETEKLVFEVERFLNSPQLKRKYPAVGEDVKVMAYRMGKDVELTIAMAVIDRYIESVSDYVNLKEAIKNEVLDLASRITELPVRAVINAADDVERGRLYLTVTGTSAESGDDGNTGRGNRANGLITPCRPMSMEATAGKNPVSHVGKIYNILAYRISKRVYEEAKGVREVYTKVLSKIGTPIDEPCITSVQLLMEEGASFSQAKSVAEAVVEDELSRVTTLTEEILQRRVMLF